MMNFKRIHSMNFATFDVTNSYTKFQQIPWRFNSQFQQHTMPSQVKPGDEATGRSDLDEGSTSGF